MYVNLEIEPGQLFVLNFEQDGRIITKTNPVVLHVRENELKECEIGNGKARFRKNGKFLLDSCRSAYKKTKKQRPDFILQRN